MERRVISAQSKYWTSGECADEWHTTSRTVRTWCAEGLIPGVDKVGSQWRIPRDSKPPDFEKKRLPAIGRGWWETLPNKAEFVLAVRAYIHRVKADTGMSTLDRRFHYGPSEELVIESIAARDVKVASINREYTELMEVLWKKARGKDGWTTVKTMGESWVATVEGTTSEEVRAKANELIETLKPYNTL